MQDAPSSTRRGVVGDKRVPAPPTPLFKGGSRGDRGWGATKALFHFAIAPIDYSLS
jgi:hypothetical protein